MANTDPVRLQSDLFRIESTLRDVEMHAQGNGQRPAQAQEVGRVARSVRELVKIVQDLAAAVTPESN